METESTNAIIFFQFFFFFSFWVEPPSIPETEGIIIAITFFSVAPQPPPPRPAQSIPKTSERRGFVETTACTIARY